METIYLSGFLDFLVWLVLILPMRNGNTIIIYHCNIWLIVLILPMRNGNIEKEKSKEKEKTKFLSYL